MKVQGGREPNLGRLSVVDVNLFRPTIAKIKEVRALLSAFVLRGAVSGDCCKRETVFCSVVSVWRTDRDTPPIRSLAAWPLDH